MLVPFSIVIEMLFIFLIALWLAIGVTLLLDHYKWCPDNWCDSQADYRCTRGFAYMVTIIVLIWA